MVFYALTHLGYLDVVEHLGEAPKTLWLNEGVLSAEQVESLRACGHEVTVFSARRDPSDAAAIWGDLATIQAHHPGASIWVELTAMA